MRSSGACVIGILFSRHGLKWPLFRRRVWHHLSSLYPIGVRSTYYVIDTPSGLFLTGRKEDGSLAVLLFDGILGTRDSYIIHLDRSLGRDPFLLFNVRLERTDGEKSLELELGETLLSCLYQT